MFYHKTPHNYYSQSRPEMLEFVPLDSRKILEIGCGQADFALSLKKNLGAEVWGLEKEAAAAKIAKTKLDQVLEGDIISLLKELPDNYFDCLVLNDVLEHLVDPYSLLIDLKSKLNQGGVIVFSVPNVRYLLNLKNLLVNKQWRYENEGILDRSHLRFFTKKSLIETFQSLGFSVEKIKGINPISAWKFNLINILFLNYLADTRYLQFAGVIKPK